jgi:hypothetical protein
LPGGVVVSRLSPIELTLAERKAADAARLLAAGHELLARRDATVALVALCQALGIQHEFVRGLVDACESQGLSDYEAAHHDGRILVVDEAKTTSR